MYIEKLTLKNFRNYKLLDICFSPEINFIIGENGTGKTNILEAVSITANMKSFRNINDSEIIRWGEQSYYCCSTVGESERSKFEVGCAYVTSQLKKRYKIDDCAVRGSSDYYGKLLTVIFAPVDINLINGPPDLRRRFFDSVISKINSDYLASLNDFKKILASRNRLLKILKHSRAGTGQLDVWDRLFSEKASELIARRMEFIERYRHTFADSYLHISGEETSPEIVYRASSGSGDAEFIESRLHETRDRDIIMGYTGVGPQRDDYVIASTTGLLFTNYASQGQRRTAAISLKLAEFQTIEESTGEKAIILVDDIFSELDLKRRRNMIDLFGSGNQMILTMVNEESIERKRFLNGRSYMILENAVVQELHK